MTKSQSVGVISFAREKFVQNMARIVQYVCEEVVFFWSRVECCTVSKALLKSSAMTTTYELHQSSSITDWRMATRAAVVDPVRRKAY